MAGQRTHDRQLLVIGSACAALGLYFVLVGLGLAPAPSKINGPQWLATCVGLVFLAGRGDGTGARLAQLAGRAGCAGGRPARFARAGIDRGGGLLRGACQRGTWVTFSEATRHFVLPLRIGGPLAEYVGRAAFGLGAIMSWAIAAAFAHMGAKRVFRKKS